MDTLSIEDALRAITEEAAVIRFLSDSGSYADYQAPDSAVLSGLGTLGRDIEELTARVKGALNGSVLDTPLPSLSALDADRDASHSRRRQHAR